MSSRWARLSRGVLAAVFATLIASLSHALAGGGTPSTLSLAVSLAFSTLVCVALTGRRLSAVRMSLAVAISQFAFHGLFSTLGGATGHVVVTGHGSHAATSTLVETTPVAAHHTSAWMWLAHALAAVATIAVLRRGERAFWHMRDTALRFVAVVFAAMPVIVEHRSVEPGISRVDSPTVFEFLHGSLQHRGPPALSF